MLNSIKNDRRLSRALCIVLLLFTTTSPSIADPNQQPTFKQSSTIAINASGSTLVVANPDSNSVSLVDTNGQFVIAEVPVGLKPRTIGISPTNDRAYVANFDDDSLSVIDIDSRSVISTTQVGDRPVGVAFSPDGKVLAVSEMGTDRIRFLDPERLGTLKLVPVADRPFGLAFSPDGRSLLISHLLSGVVTLLTFAESILFFPLIQVNPSSERANYSGLPKLITSPSSQRQPGFDIFSQNTISTWMNVAPAPAVIINQDGTRAYLPQTMANGLGLNTGFDTSVFPKVSVLNLETRSHQTSEHVSLPEIDQPVGVPWDAALNKDDSELWVVNAGSNDISVINITNPTFPTGIANIPVGDHPRGIVFSPDGNTAYVNNTLSGTVSIIDVNTYTVIRDLVVTDIPLPPGLLRGKRLFFSSALPELSQAAWISCNTCHVEGEHDGRTWMLQYLGSVPPGEDPIIRRNTTSLLGMIETYPLRWSAEWDESADSEFSIRFEQFGDGLIDGDMHPTLGLPNQGRSEDLDYLAMYIDSLVVPERSQTLTAAELSGKVIFESEETQCSVCHPAPLYTDLLVHDVATADGPGEWFGPLIDTPTLRFLYDSAPYLHDGSAASLYDVLVTRNLGDEHGVTSHLTAGQIQDLIAFLIILPFEP